MKAKRDNQLKKSQVNIWDRCSLNNHQASNLNQIKKIWSEILNKGENKKFIEACDYLEANMSIKDESLLPLFFSHLHEDLKFCYMMDRFERDLYKKQLAIIDKTLFLLGDEDLDYNDMINGGNRNRLQPHILENFMIPIVKAIMFINEGKKILKEQYSHKKKNPSFELAKYSLVAEIHSQLMQNEEASREEFDKYLGMACDISAQLIRGLDCKDSSKLKDGGRIRRRFKEIILNNPSYFYSYAERYIKHF